VLRVAVLSNDADLTNAVAASLREMGHDGVIPEPDESAWLRLRACTPDAAILDLEDAGSDMLRELREVRRDDALVDLPVMVLVSRKAAADLDPAIGFDDFGCRDEPPDVLAARMRFLLWRRLGLDSQDTIQVGNLAIQTARYEVTIKGGPVELTYREYELLRFLASNADRAFSRAHLLDRVWGADYFGGERTVDVHIRRLRFKLGGEEGSRIQTVRNVGYMFRAD